MQRKVALFINGTRGEFVLRGLKKNGIFIDNIFSQKDIKKDHKEIKKKTTLNDNYIFIFVGINQIISKSLLKTPRSGCFNCHAGKLPKYRGTSIIPWQIINGEKSGECNILKMTEKVDDGKIYLKRKYQILKSDNATTISNKCNLIFLQQIMSLIRNFKNKKKLIFSSQKNSTKNMIWTKRKPEDGKIDWNDKTRNICNLVRALNEPYPGAFTYAGKRNNKLIINKCKEYQKESIKGIAGRIVKVFDNSFIVCTKNSSIEILELKNKTINHLIASGKIFVGLDLV